MPSVNAGETAFLRYSVTMKPDSSSPLHRVCRLSLCLMLMGASSSLAASSETEPEPALSARSCASFGFDFYQKLTASPNYAAASGKNLVFSPFSLVSVLDVLKTGASGKVKSELAHALHQSDTKPGDADILAPEALKDSGGALSLGNSLWVTDQVPLNPDFLKTTQDRFGSVVFNLDFKNPPAASGKINSWISDKTAGHIKDLFSPTSLDPSTILVVANAVYFKGAWKTPFPAQATREQPFRLASGKQVSAPTMQLTSQVAYGEVDGVKLLELPYEGDALSMVFLLPEDDAAVDVAPVEKRLSQPWLAGALAKLGRERVEVSIPRFSFKFEPEDTVGVLKSLGMKAMFEPSGDFAKIYDREPLLVSVFKHRAWLEVNEKGTTAAAATGGAMMATAVRMDPKVFKADRPFLFLILHRATGTPLFIGRVSNPLE